MSSYIIRVFLEDRIWNLDLESFDQITIGSGSQDTVTIRELDESQIRISRNQDDRYLISGLFLARMKDGLSSPVSEDILEVDNLYRVSGGKPLEITVHPKQKSSTSVLKLSQFDRLQIGRNRMKNDIVLSNKRTSSVHCEIVKKDGSFVLRDLNSTNGTYLNNRLIEPLREEKLYDGDVICFSIYRLYFINGDLTFFNTGNDLQLNVRSLESPEEKEKDVFHRVNSMEEPGLITSTTVQASRLLFSDASEPAGNEETQVGSELEIEKMLEEERFKKETDLKAEYSDDIEVTQVGSFEQIEQMLEEALQRKSASSDVQDPAKASCDFSELDDQTVIGTEEELRENVEKQKLCSADSAIIHLSGEDEQ